MRGIRRVVVLTVVASAAALSGIGAAHADTSDGTPGVELSPSAADFGDVPVQSPYGGGQPYAAATRTFTVTSTGSADLVVGTPTRNGTGQFGISRNTCTSPVPPGETCEIDVTVFPWFGLGPQSATLGVPSNAPDSPSTAALTATIVPRIVPTRLTADPVSMKLGPLGSLRLFPRATLTDTDGYPLPLLGLGDTGREVVFTVNGETVCRATANFWNGVASCQGLVPFLAVLRAGGYDAHFETFSYGGYTFLPSSAHGPLLG